jgi:peptidoglycan hydrolase-like protein with peptidoglycan-binding domain
VLTEEQPTVPDYPPEEPRPRRWPKRVAVGVAVLVPLLLVGGFVVVALGMSGTKLTSDPSSLGKVDIDSFGGEVESVTATAVKNGKTIPVKVSDGTILPKGKLHAGEKVKLEVTVKRPSVVGIVAGGTVTKTLTVTTPRAELAGRWIPVDKSSGVPKVEFRQPVSAVSYGPEGELVHHHFKHPKRVVTLGEQPAAGQVILAAAVRPWQRVGKFKTVTWFPASGSPTVAATPAVGSTISPSTPLELTVSKTVSKVFPGGKYPELDPSVPGKWTKTSPHSILFTPEGFGAPMDVELEAKLPEAVEVVQSDGSVKSESAVTWTVPGGSELRLQQMLADLGYMPNEWSPKSGAEKVALTPEAQVRAATEPPEGEFDWRWKSTPSGLKELWKPGEEEVITQGALMSFQSEHGLETDGVAGPEVWEALMQAEIAGEVKATKGAGNGYTYVYVNESLPEEVHVWHNGKTVFNGAANTGIAGAETEAGTFPVYLRYEETTMSGENPDGSHYEDPGIKWVSYFNGGDALHAFDRPSYGSPQSLGCVEMPLEEAETVWPYTPIGTPVTIEA